MLYIGHIFFKIKYFYVNLQYHSLISYAIVYLKKETNTQGTDIFKNMSGVTENLKSSQEPNKERRDPDSSDTPDEEKKDDRIFECNICLDTAKDAVVSMCGHLFCWPCLHQWLETRPNRQVCPVCKASISKEKVVPLYGRGSSKQEDPREKVPPRPAGQRTEPEPGSAFSGFGFADNGFHMSFGIGAFPFGFFTSTFNFGDARPTAAARGTQQHMEEQFLSKIFLWMAILFVAWLLLA